MSVRRRSSGLAVSPQPLTPKAFAPYGELVQHLGDEKRYDVVGSYAYTEPSAKPMMWINRIDRHPDSAITVDRMERHPHSPQTFVPLLPGRCLAVVAMPDVRGEPDMASLKAFVTQPGQGVIYRPNIWHFAFTALDQANDVLVLMGLTNRADDFIVTEIVPAVPISTALTGAVAQ
jgi:ureidoglycolate lyase